MSSTVRIAAPIFLPVSILGSAGLAQRRGIDRGDVLAYLGLAVGCFAASQGEHLFFVEAQLGTCPVKAGLSRAESPRHLGVAVPVTHALGGVQADR